MARSARYGFTPHKISQKLIDTSLFIAYPISANAKPFQQDTPTHANQGMGDVLLQQRSTAASAQNPRRLAQQDLFSLNSQK